MLDLQGFKVGIAGAVPSRQEQKAFQVSEFDIHQVLETLAERILATRGRIIYGSHPTFTPIIEKVALSAISDGTQGKPVIMFVSRGFFHNSQAWEAYDSRHRSYAEVRATGEVGAIVNEMDERHREAAYRDNLAKMRDSLTREWRALICLGGKSEADPPGLKDEIDRTLRNVGPIPLFLLGYLGGYTHEIWNQRFRFAHESINRLSDEENKRLNSQGSPDQRIRAWQAVDLVMAALLAEGPRE
jgi:hypothetical protein